MPRGPRVSQEMKDAQSLLWKGATGYAASKATGISEGAISKSKTCQAIMQSVRTMVATLANDRATSDAHLLEHFMSELCVPEHHARAYVAHRTGFQQGAARLPLEEAV